MNKNTAFRFLIEYLETTSIDYCLLGASEQYPNSLGDIDVAVSCDVFGRLDALLQDFCGRHQFMVVQKMKHESTACSYVLAYFIKADNTFFFVEVDFCSDYKRAGRLYLLSETLMNNRSWDATNNYRTLNDAYAFLYYFLKKADKGSLDAGQFASLHYCWHKAKPAIVVVLKPYVGEIALAGITKSFDNCNFESLQSKLPCIRKALHAHTPKRVKDVVLNSIRLIKRIAHPTGLMVCVLGRDGSGKSTFSLKLMESVASCFRRTSKFHLYPGLIFRYMASGANVTTPHAGKARNTLLSFLKLNLLFVEFFCGYWLKVYPKKVTTSFLLFDRYFIDVLADPVRYRNTNNKTVIKFFHALLPKPDAWIILDLDSDVLIKRKSELSYDLSESLKKKYLQVKDTLPNSVVINTGKEITESINEATAFVLNTMNRKLLNK